ncbi:MAG: glycerol-3-phosphate responsive antiterminator, partial [Acidobacteriota bacterium]
MRNDKGAGESAGKVARAKHHWDEILGQTRVIAAVRSTEALEKALASPVRIVYLLFGNPMNIATMVKAVREAGKLALVNADLLQGFSRDAFAVEYLASCGTSGIISTNHETLRAARALELVTVLRTFMIDSASVDSGRRFLVNFQPDAIELLPAIAAPLVIDRIRAGHPELHVIAGGLVTNLKQVEGLVAATVDAVSLSDPELWVV